MGAELPPQRLMQQMRRGMVRPDPGPPRMIDSSHDSSIDPDDAGLDHAQMHEYVRKFLLRIGHPDAQTVGSGDHAGIADLAPALAVKRGLVQHQCYLGPW